MSNRNYNTIEGRLLLATEEIRCFLMQQKNLSHNFLEPFFDLTTKIENHIATTLANPHNNNDSQQKSLLIKHVVETLQETDSKFRDQLSRQVAKGDYQGLFGIFGSARHNRSFARTMSDVTRILSGALEIDHSILSSHLEHHRDNYSPVMTITAPLGM